MYPKGHYSNKGNPYLQINCFMDMDSMEITKTKAIKKYEENNYLLGRIFEIEEKNNNQKSPKNAAQATNNQYSNIKEKSTGTNNSKNKKNNLYNNNNKLNEGLDVTEFFEEKMEEGDYDTEEKIDSAIREFSKIYEDNKWEDRTLLKKLNEIYSNYKKEEEYLEKERTEFEKSSKKYENLISSFKNLKSNIEIKDIVDLVKQCENEGFLLEKTKKDFDKFVNEYNNNPNNLDIDDTKMIIEDVKISEDEKELPFDHQAKIITFPI